MRVDFNPRRSLFPSLQVLLLLPAGMGKLTRGRYCIQCTVIHVHVYMCTVYMCIVYMYDITDDTIQVRDERPLWGEMVKWNVDFRLLKSQRKNAWEHT